MVQAHPDPNLNPNPDPNSDPDPDPHPNPEQAQAQAATRGAHKLVDRARHEYGREVRVVESTQRARRVSFGAEDEQIPRRRRVSFGHDEDIPRRRRVSFGEAEDMAAGANLTPNPHPNP